MEVQLICKRGMLKNKIFYSEENEEFKICNILQDFTWKDCIVLMQFNPNYNAWKVVKASVLN